MWLLQFHCDSQTLFSIVVDFRNVVSVNVATQTLHLMSLISIIRTGHQIIFFATVSEKEFKNGEFNLTQLLGIQYTYKSIQASKSAAIKLFTLVTV